ncbi:MAG: FAD-dependent oxidoreductase, partial [Verrucomicrobia bacterium]|nr:FAD-dependent oxidoreductase [Verrucomicrobiota bacterium]
MNTTFDFLVIGGGSAGYAAASVASQLGMSVALVEGGEELGGLCILRGC